MIGDYNLQNKKEFTSYVIDTILHGTINDLSKELKIPLNIIQILDNYKQEVFIDELYKLYTK